MRQSDRVRQTPEWRPPQTGRQSQGQGGWRNAWLLCWVSFGSGFQVIVHVFVCQFVITYFAWVGLVANKMCLFVQMCIICMFVYCLMRINFFSIQLVKFKCNCYCFLLYFMYMYQLNPKLDFSFKPESRDRKGFQWQAERSTTRTRLHRRRNVPPELHEQSYQTFDPPRGNVLLSS